MVLAPDRIRPRIDHTERAEKIYRRAFGGPGGIPPVSDDNQQPDRGPDKPPTWGQQIKNAFSEKQIFLLAGLMGFGIPRALVISSTFLFPYPPADMQARLKQVNTALDGFTYNHEKGVKVMGGITIANTALIGSVLEILLTTPFH